ncbi:MAG TPA: hypothetical protein VG496_06280 [Myxococcales bacterium]|nr:hypothetical protein [Myxococcales bacterium]
MSLLSDAAAMARGRVVAVFLTAALPLVPACLVASGIVRVAVAQAQAELGSPTGGKPLAERSQELPPDAPAENRKEILLQAREPGTVVPRSVSLALLAGLLLAALVALGGVFVAQGMLLHLAVGGCETARACGSIAARSRPLFSTTGAALVLTAIGFVALVLPGLITALMVSLAAPVAVAEGRSGFAAVQRSWELMKRAWPAQLALLLAGAVPLLLFTQGVGRMLPPRALQHALLDAAGTVLFLPLPTFASAVLYLRERAAVEGKRVEDVRQYILRMSAPG